MTEGDAAQVEPTDWQGAPWVRVLARWAPWASLAISVAGALWMKRDDDAAALVAAGVAGSSLTMSLLLWLRRSRHAEEGTGLYRVMDLAGVVATQSLAQLPLFFSAPFYLLAFAHTPLQFFFFALFAMAAVAVSWDPLAYALLPHRRAGVLLVAFCSFVGLRAALPMLGVPAGWTLTGSLLAIGLLAFWDLHLRWPGVSVARRLGAALALSLLLLGLALTMPPAPLRLVHGGIGTGVQERELVNEGERFSAGQQLFCFTAVFSPRETEATLEHRWTRDGEPLAELELPVRGGRRGGYRTWSRLQAGRAGVYQCEVRNSIGQVLGQLTANVR